MCLADQSPAVLLLQHQPVRDHGDELAVGGFALGIAHRAVVHDPAADVPILHLLHSELDQAVIQQDGGALAHILGQAGVKCGYIGNSRVSHTGYFPAEATHNAPGRTVDMSEILQRGPAFDKVVEEEELWEHFNYFLKAALPVAHEYGMRLSVHPSDPPYPMYEGYASLMYNSDCFRKAFAMADAIVPDVLGMKFCCGCWLEGGKAFGDILADLREFVRAGRVMTVHFRNVSSPLP